MASIYEYNFSIYTTNVQLDLSQKTEKIFYCSEFILLNPFCDDLRNMFRVGALLEDEVLAG